MNASLTLPRDLVDYSAGILLIRHLMKEPIRITSLMGNLAADGPPGRDDGQHGDGGSDGYGPDGRDGRDGPDGHGRDERWVSHGKCRRDGRHGHDGRSDGNAQEPFRATFPTSTFSYDMWALNGPVSAPQRYGWHGIWYRCEEMRLTLLLLPLPTFFDTSSF